MGLFSRAIRPPDDVVPNPNDPTQVPPSTVGPDQLVTPGDPSGVIFAGEHPPAGQPPTILPSAWSGWPADWWPPLWNSQSLAHLTDVAWLCIDRNTNALASMPPYLVDAAPTLNADWLRNPSPDLYTSWEEFAKTLFWDFQGVGEAFVLATAWYATGWPSRFHVVPPWMVEVELVDGRRSYTIGRRPVGPEEILHVRYQSSAGNARGSGPLEAGSSRLVAAKVMDRYATKVASGAIPAGILTYPASLGDGQAPLLRQQWTQARQEAVGEVAILSGGVTWTPTEVNAKDMALLELSQANDGIIAELLGVPRELIGLPGGSSMTYKNMNDLFVRHWRQGLRPMAQTVMSALSGWLLPRQTRVELNRDEYIAQDPLLRAQTAQILNAIVDPVTGQQALTVDEIRAAERLDNSTPTNVAQGVLR